MRSLTLIVLLLAACAPPALLPDRLGELTAREPVTRHEGRAIFDHLNGAAEVYLMHGFRSLATRGYRTASGRVIVVEIFEMADPEGAYGAFSHARDLEGQELTRIGAEAHRQAGMIWFWRDRFLVCVGDRENGLLASPHVLERAARSVAESLPAGSRRPALVERLPRTGLRDATVRFFRVARALAYHYDGAPAEKLGLDGARAVLADYRRPAGAAVLLLAEYPRPAAAAAAARVLDTHPPRKGRARANAVLGSTLIAVLEAPTAADAAALIHEARARSGGPR